MFQQERLSIEAFSDDFHWIILVAKGFSNLQYCSGEL